METVFIYATGSKSESVEFPSKPTDGRAVGLYRIYPIYR